ncbi:MAG: hypothetical protein Q4E46_02375 [Candidatus Saccharibacteria bacterium]|nr:hypothetical protein [Candidatus Saccharibacteria bacterium]
MPTKNKKIKQQSPRWKIFLGIGLIFCALVAFVAYTRSLGMAILGWTESASNGAIFRQSAWAMTNVYTETLIEVLLIIVGIQLFRGKKVARWTLICLAVFAVILVTSHIAYQILASA